MKLYETTFIMDPQLQEEGWEKAIAKYSDIIARGGTVKQVERWGLRRLAYTIKKCQQGYYVHVVHESPAGIPRELERQFLLDESCLRYLTVVADNPRYVEEMEKRRLAREAVGAAADGPAHAGGPAGLDDEPESRATDAGEARGANAGRDE